MRVLGNRKKMWYVPHTVQTVLQDTPTVPLYLPKFGLRTLCSAGSLLRSHQRSLGFWVHTTPPLEAEFMEAVPGEVNAPTLPSPPLTAGPGGAFQEEEDCQFTWAPPPIPWPQAWCSGGSLFR